MQPLTMAHVPLIAGMHHISFSDPWDEQAMTEILSMPGCSGFLLAEPDPVGFVIYRVAAEESEILSIMTLPSHRRQGLGSRLLRQACAACESLGCRDMFLEVAVENDSARQLYLSEGFETVGRRKQYYVSGGDAFVMRLDLHAWRTHIR